jgi:hypothetical protein
VFAFDDIEFQKGIAVPFALGSSTAFTGKGRAYDLAGLADVRAFRVAEDHLNAVVQKPVVAA